MAAPMAAGVAALMLAADPTLSVDDLLWGLSHRVSAFPSAATLGVGACLPDAGDQGHCACTTGTCGSGMLDAELAVNWAIEHASQSGAATASATTQSACYFSPAREGGTSSCGETGSSGGGGALGDLDLLALVLITLMGSRWKLTFRAGRR